MVTVKARRLFLIGLLLLVAVFAADMLFSSGLQMRHALASMLPVLPVPPEEGGVYGAAHVFREVHAEKLLTDGEAESLDLVVPNGSIRVECSRGGDLEIQVAVTARALTRDDADRYAARVTSRVQQYDGWVTTTLSAPLAPREVTELVADWTVRVPPGINISLNVTGGEVHVSGVRGDVWIAAIQSPMVRVEDVEGRATVSLSRSPGVVRRIDGDLQLSSRLADVQVEDVGGTVRATVLDFGATSIRRAEKVIMRGTMGMIELQEVQEAEVETMLGTVTVILTDLEAGLEYDLLGRRIIGDVPLDVQPEARHQRALGRIGRGEAQIRVTSRMGDIEILTFPGP